MTVFAGPGCEDKNAAGPYFSMLEEGGQLIFVSEPTDLIAIFKVLGDCGESQS